MNDQHSIYQDVRQTTKAVGTHIKQYAGTLLIQSRCQNIRTHTKRDTNSYQSSPPIHKSYVGLRDDSRLYQRIPPMYPIIQSLTKGYQTIPKLTRRYQTIRTYTREYKNSPAEKRSCKTSYLLDKITVIENIISFLGFLVTYDVKLI